MQAVRPERKGSMAVAICCNSREEYAVIEEAVNEYAREHECMFPSRWFYSVEDFRRENAGRHYDIVILACDDIVNQELAVSVRDESQLSQIIWIGEDQRFGLSSYRLGVANFVLKPATKQDVWESLKRCRDRLRRELQRMDVRYADLGLNANLMEDEKR